MKHFSLTRLLAASLATTLAFGATTAVADSAGPLSIETDAGKPLWEAGVFAAAFRGPLFPASSDSQNKFLPVPYFIYRGETIRVGDESLVKAIAVEKERFKLDVSLSGAFNADSEESDIRQGMPDLDFMFEIGPEASFLLADDLTTNKDDELWLNLPVRSVFSTDFASINHRGYVFQPELAFSANELLFAKSRFFASIAPIFTTDKTQAYFYDVDQQFVNSERGFYQSEGGYLGTEVSIANTFLIDEQMTVFVGAQLGFWQGAQNQDSDLHQQDFTYSLAVGMRWIWKVSEQKVR